MEQNGINTDVERVKELLESEDIVIALYKEKKLYNGTIPMRPILHNENEIILQFHGWSINLFDDGTWIWEATDGG